MNAEVDSFIEIWLESNKSASQSDEPLSCSNIRLLISTFNMENDWLLNIGNLRKKQKNKCMKSCVIPCVSQSVGLPNTRISM